MSLQMSADMSLTIDRKRRLAKAKLLQNRARLAASSTGSTNCGAAVATASAAPRQSAEELATRLNVSGGHRRERGRAACC